MSGTAIPAIPAPVTADPGFWKQGIEGLNLLRDQQAKQASADAYRQSMNPDGTVNVPKYNALIASGPGAWNAGELMRQQGAAGIAQTGAAQGQFNLATGQNNAVNAAITAALASPDDQLKATVAQQAQRLVAAGVVPHDRMMQSMLNLSNDPAQLRQQLETLRVQTLPPQQQQDVIYGKPLTYTAPGGGLQGAVQDPRRGGGLSGGGQPALPQGQSPEGIAGYQRWLKEPRDYPDPANPTVTKHGTNETYQKDLGVPDQYIYPGGAPATPGTQPAASPLGTGRLPPALQNPNRPPPAATPSPAPVPSPAGTPISGPTPEQSATAAATKAQGELSPPRFQAEADAGTQAQSQQATLGNMLADTAQFTTGPLAGIVGKVRNFAGNLGLNINTEAQSAKESFNKLAAGLANAQGAGSDQRMQVNINANPHEELSPAGVDLVTRQLQGNADYLQARAKLAQQHPNKADYPGFQQTVAGLDPRVFQLSRMTQDQRTAYMNALDSEAKKQLGAAIRKAKDMGVLGGG